MDGTAGSVIDFGVKRGGAGRGAASTTIFTLRSPVLAAIRTLDVRSPGFRGPEAESWKEPSGIFLNEKFPFASVVKELSL